MILQEQIIILIKSSVFLTPSDERSLLRLDLFVSYSGHFIQLCLSHPIKSYSPLQKTFGALQWCASFQLGQHTNSHILCKGEKEAKYYFSIAVFTMIIILFINMSIKLFYIWKQLNYFYFEALLLWTSPQWTIFIDLTTQHWWRKKWSKEEFILSSRGRIWSGAVRWGKGWEWVLAWDWRRWWRRSNWRRGRRCGSIWWGDRLRARKVRGTSSCSVGRVWLSR